MPFPSWLTRSLVLALFLVPVVTTGIARAQTPPLRVLQVTVSGALTPVQAEMFDDSLTFARDKGMDALLVRLDTPGGGVDTMRRMMRSILGAPFPVIVYVTPPGAHAASAGVFVMAAATVNAMAPTTTMGSASPVGLGGSDLGKTMKRKITHDLQSQLRAVLALRGRNVTWYMQSVANAANLTAQEAVSQRVVDYLAVDQNDLWTQIGKRGLPVHGETRFFAPAAVQETIFEPTLRYRMFSWLLEPKIAYLLLVAGIIGLFFELVTPGALFPGVFGGLCLLVALYALSVLPTTATGILLLLLSGVLFVVELYVVSYGLLAVSGIICLGLGSLLLFDGAPMTGLSLQLILPTVLGLGLVVAAALRLLAKAQRLQPRTGLEAMVGEQAVVRHWQGQAGKVFVHGELWNATSQHGESFAIDQQVVVTGGADMQLIVAPHSEEA